MQLQDVLDLELKLSAAPAKVSEGDAISLVDVLQKVRAAIQEYHDGLGGGADLLPPLLSVELDFKTTIGVTAGISFNILIFKIGASVKKENLHDISFTYVPNQKTAAELELLKKVDKTPTDLTDGLAKAIQEAAKANKKADDEEGKKSPEKRWISKQVTVTIQFGVTWDGNASAAFSLLAIGPYIDYSKASVHSAKVTFAVPAPQITGILPAIPAVGSTDLTVSGANFLPGLTVVLTRPGLTIAPIQIVEMTPTQLKLNTPQLPPLPVAGQYSIKVVNPPYDPSSASNVFQFTVR